MLSRVLRVLSLLVLLASIALAWALYRAGLPLWVAVPIAALLPLAIHAVPLGIEFITGALTDRRPVARLPFGDAVRTWWRETRRSLQAFGVDQPWRAGFKEPEVIRDPARSAVLLIHGYMCNRAVWRPWIVAGKLPSEWNVATIDLEPVFGPVDDYAAVLDKAVHDLQLRSGAERVTLVAHSMGGLAARAYLRKYGHAAIGRVITIDSPHHGTVFARFAHGANTRQMRSACDYVRKLAEQKEAADFVCFASQHDNLIVPRDSQVLEGAEAVWFERIGHLAMTDDDAVLGKLIEVVERPLPADASSPVRNGCRASDSPAPVDRQSLSAFPPP